jgi:hypothetical protein
VIRDIVLNVFVPALIACAVMAVAWRPWQRGERAVERGAWSSPIAFGAGYLVSFIVVSGGIDTSLERWQWLGVLVLVAAVGGVILEIGRRPLHRTWLIVAVVAATAVWMIDLPRVDAWSWRIGLGGSILVSFAALDLVARRPGDLGLPVALMLVFSVTSALVFQANFLKLALMAGSLGAVSGVLMVTALLNRHAMLGRAGALFVATVLPTMLMTGYAYDYAEIPVWVFALPLIAILALPVTALPVLARRSSAALVGARLLVVLIPCALALLFAFAGTDDDAEADDYGDYSEYGSY